MNIGSHNSLSYQRPKKWWMRPFHFMAKCQDFDFVDQYILGARVFDLRISFDKKHAGKVQVRHGAMEFDVPMVLLNSFYDFLNYEKDCYLRVILEFNKEPKDIEYQEQRFRIYCEQLENKYKNIKFFLAVIESTIGKLYMSLLMKIFLLLQTDIQVLHRYLRAIISS